MRKLPQQIKNTILEVLPKEMTDAIYIFGSYGTKYYLEGSSDIDIAWYVNYDIDWFDAMDYREILEEKLNMKVDLLVNEKNNLKLLVNILEGDHIGELSQKFCDWFDDFVINKRDDIEFMLRGQENIDRLRNIHDELNKCNLRLKRQYRRYHELTGEEQEDISQAFRYNFTGYKELIGSYMTHVLKSISFSSQNGYMSCVKKCIDESLLDEKYRKFILNLNKLRNQNTHSYERPELGVLFEYYNKNQIDFDGLVDYIFDKIIEIENIKKL